MADRFGAPPAAIHNLLEYALLKATAERMLVSSIERKGNQVAVKFHPETPVEPERVVALLRKRPGLRMDPGGTLWIDAERGGGTLTQSVRNVLLQLQS